MYACEGMGVVVSLLQGLQKLKTRGLHELQKSNHFTFSYIVQALQKYKPNRVGNDSV